MGLQRLEVLNSLSYKLKLDAKGSQHNIPKADSFGENRMVTGKSSEKSEEKEARSSIHVWGSGRCPGTDWVYSRLRFQALSKAMRGSCNF